MIYYLRGEAPIRWSLIDRLGRCPAPTNKLIGSLLSDQVKNVKQALIILNNRYKYN